MEDCFSTDLGGVGACMAGGTGHAPEMGLCLPEAASRNEDSSNSRCRKIPEAVILKISLCYLLYYFNSSAIL